MKRPGRKRSKPTEQHEPAEEPTVPDGPDRATRNSFFGFLISLLDRPPRRKGPPR